MTAKGKILQKLLNRRAVFFILFFGFFATAFSRAYMRVNTTLIGYDIGRLKTVEAELLQKRSRLRMELAQITTKKHLSMMATSEFKQHPGKKLAQKL